MDVLLSLINAFACGLIALALIGAVLSPRVHDGVVIKLGLISMALGFGAIALRMTDEVLRNDAGIERALALINGGIAVVILGYLLRKAQAGHALRRMTDWGDLDIQPPEDR